MKKYKGFQISWWLTFINIVLSFFSQTVIYCFFKDIDNYIATLIAQLFLIIPIVLGIFLIKTNFPYDTLNNALGFNFFNITFLIPLLIMPICASYFISLAISPVNILIYEFFGTYDVGISAPKNLYEFFMLLLSLCIAAPILEEIFFRGILVKFLDRYGTVFTVVMSSLSFAMLHFNPSGFINIFLLGIILCILRLGTNSILCPIMFHLSNNFYSLMLLIFEKEILINTTVILILAALFPILFILFFTVYSNKFYYIGIKENKGISVGFILSIIIYLIYSAQEIMLNFNLL